VERAAACDSAAPPLSMSNGCVPHPSTLSSVPSVFVSVQFCATESTEKVFLCTESRFCGVFRTERPTENPTETQTEKHQLEAHPFDVLTPPCKLWGQLPQLTYPYVASNNTHIHTKSRCANSTHSSCSPHSSHPSRLQGIVVNPRPSSPSRLNHRSSSSTGFQPEPTLTPSPTRRHRHCEKKAICPQAAPRFSSISPSGLNIYTCSLVGTRYRVLRYQRLISPTPSSY
jgi:hypothetical protein